MDSVSLILTAEFGASSDLWRYWWNHCSAVVNVVLPYYL